MSRYDLMDKAGEIAKMMKSGVDFGGELIDNGFMSDTQHFIFRKLYDPYDLIYTSQFAILLSYNGFGIIVIPTDDDYETIELCDNKLYNMIFYACDELDVNALICVSDDNTRKLAQLSDRFIRR